jgi:hypothetical protein
LIAQELATMQDAQRMSPNLVPRDPYTLDFLRLRDTWREAVIIREMESTTEQPRILKSCLSIQSVAQTELQSFDRRNSFRSMAWPRLELTGILLPLNY